MASPYSILTFSLIITVLSLSKLSHSFSPIDNYLIDCGSTSPATIDVDHRRFTGDSSSTHSNSFILSSDRSVALRIPNPSLGLSPIYHTARVFKTPSKYEFQIRDKGTHLLRLHFHQLDYATYGPHHARFHVTVNGVLLLLSNFTGYDLVNPRIKEYMIWVDTEKLVITFTPLKRSNFAYVNAIELISAPKDLVADSAESVNSNKVEKLNGLVKNSLETVYRINVGGPKVTPFNDSLWRTWVPDEEFLKLSDGSKKMYFSGRIKYQMGGASREVGPDNVYNSARLISSENAMVPKFNITWSFLVVGGYKYLVRMHFCDIASISLELLIFNVYVNGHLAYENLDLSAVTNEMLASPFYADFVVDFERSGFLNVSVGPSKMSIPRGVDAILNGVEIMKMNNSMGSLDGEVSAKMVLKSWPRRNSCVLVPLIVLVSLLLVASVVMQGRRILQKDSVAWSRLPVDVFEGNLNYGNPHRSGKA